MKIIIIADVDELTDNYHSGGALAVVAESDEAALQMLTDDPHIAITDKEWETRVEYELMDNAVPRIFTFPNAGCC